jgi:FkbM family methyltransferase
VGPAVEHRRILQSKPWRTIVDIGSNKGQFALAATAIHPSAVVHSFEPLAGPAAKFENIFEGAPNIHLHRFAIGTSSETANIFVSAREDSSSLLPISDRQTQMFPGTEAVGTERVEVRPLSAILRPGDIAPHALLKLDVQGYEYPALLGCEELLSCFQAVYVECSFVELYTGQRLLSDIEGWLYAKGYRMTDIGDLTRDSSGRVVQGDFLFESS